MIVLPLSPPGSVEPGAKRRRFPPPPPNGRPSPATVELTADEPAEGMRFAGWRIDSGGPLDGVDLSSPSTTFTMPANDVEATALYEPVPTPTPTPTRPTHSPSHGPGLPETGSSTLMPIAATVGLLAFGGLHFPLRRGLREGRH
ncbi:InlB B-repeat-containing protein [Streptomyces sp. KE1]|uniref:InlB B-repeat-containing protein n=1 Tax=Streptomyces sp. KE1 TaxID=1638939 RepID=UPI000A619EFA|nr:hypothetical protein [Streptomyces sp. KE1]